jgi:hypothetical protein
MDVSPLDANRRQERFLARLRSAGTLWVLMLDGGLANWNEDDDLVIPLWDSEPEALACAAKTFSGYQARSIELEDFRVEWLPMLIERDAWFAIQPVASTAGNQIPARMLDPFSTATEPNKAMDPTGLSRRAPRAAFGAGGSSPRR